MIRIFLLFCCCSFFMLCPQLTFAQLERSVNQPLGPGGAPLNIDSSLHKTNTAQWNNERIRVYWLRPFASALHTPDSGIHLFHQRNILPHTYHNLGNSGSSSYPLLFTPYNNNGPTLGYHQYDLLRFDVDSLRYYNTTRPYSEFHYELGSKQEQQAQIIHSQNITPDWNFAFRYRKIVSPGFYKIQRTNHDNASLSTQYESPRKNYRLYAGAVYNHQQQDENGGIVSDSFFQNPQYGERALIPVLYQNDAYSSQRSSVQNVLRDFAVQLQQAYILGKGDTVYNSDSTEFDYRLEPKFRVVHQAKFQSMQYRYEDFTPDTLQYLPLVAAVFANDDSVMVKQKWWTLDNNFQLGGFFGPAARSTSFTAGVGVRLDHFETWDTLRRDVRNSFSTYLLGSLQREGVRQKWDYQARGRIYITGMAAGDFQVEASLGRKLGNWGNVFVHFQQQLNSAPYNYRYQKISVYEMRKDDYVKESVSRIGGGLDWIKAGLRIEAANYTLANYFFLNSSLQADQFTSLFNVLQLQGRYRLQLKNWVLDNYIAYQQPTSNAPINIPIFRNWHQLSLETKVFRDALSIATGVEAGWHTPFEAAGYAPLLGRFFYQNTVVSNNGPYASVFFNFKVKKRFRCYIMGDQLQQLWSENLTYSPGYPYQNAMLRFGFTWLMIN